MDSDASGNMVDQKLYRSMIGSLLYVTVSRPDVMFSVVIERPPLATKYLSWQKRVLIIATTKIVWQ